MTATLFNGSNAPIGQNIDGFVYPQFLFDPMRAPTTNDIYNAGTRWQDNSQTPKVIYETTGAGNWAAVNTSGSFTNLTANGTVNLNTSGAGVTTIGTGGTGAVAIGNASGNTTVTGALNVTGDVNLTSIATKISLNGGAVTDFIGTATLVAGTVTIANTNIAAGDRILITRNTLNASPALGNLIYTISAGASFTVDSYDATGVAEVTDVSGFSYVIFRQT